MDILTVVSTVSGLFGVIDRATRLVDKLAQKREVSGEELDDVKAELKDAQKILEAVRRIGFLLPMYIEFFNGLHELAILCNKIEETIVNSQDLLAMDESSLEEGEVYKRQFLWAELARYRRDITDLRADNVLVLKRRVAFLDEYDARDIENQVEAWEEQFNKAEARFESKNVEDLLGNVQAMAKIAGETSAILKSSIANMVDALKLVER